METYRGWPSNEVMIMIHAQEFIAFTSSLHCRTPRAKTTFFESAQMWVKPQLPFGGSPAPPHCIWSTLPSSPTSPSLPTLPLPLPPYPPGSFFDALGGGDLGCSAEVRGRKVEEGECPPSGTQPRNIPKWYLWGRGPPTFAHAMLFGDLEGVVCGFCGLML